MKKFFIIIIFSFLLCNNVYAQKIYLDCKYPSGTKFGLVLATDLVSKKVNQYPFEKGSTNKIIKFTSFTQGEGSTKNLMFLKINLNKNTVELIKRDGLDINSFEAMTAYKKDDFFTLIQASNPRVTLSCDRVNKVDSVKNQNTIITGNIKENNIFKCIENENNFKSTITVIKKINNNEVIKTSLTDRHFIIKEEMDINIGTTFSSIYFANNFGDHLSYFTIEKLDGAAAAELTFANLYPEESGKRELRYIIFRLTENEYNTLKNLPRKLGKLELKIKNTNLNTNEYKNEIFFFNEVKKIYRKITKTQQNAENKLVGGSRYFCK